MKKKKIFTIGNILYTISIAFALYVLYISYADRLKLPPGVCPINDKRTLIVLAIVLLVLSTVWTSIVDFKNKKKKNEPSEPETFDVLENQEDVAQGDDEPTDEE